MKNLKRALLLWIFPILGYLIVRLLFWSCKKRYEISEAIPQSGVVVAFWHGELLLQPFLYHRLRAKPRISVMISEHFDGEIIARLIGFFGLETIRGSSSKGGKRALLRAIRELDGGGDVAITPDGPRGPYHSVADGIIALSQKTARPIVIFRAHFSNAWHLKSWDKFAIPKPFSSVRLIAHEPLSVEGLSLEEARSLIKQKMEEEA